ncbi:MAG: hypothetical protein K6E46_07520 [Lachnospiraceae bacterium]|nr:hypothetical protein [Lachnospiraceae bacterium]
MSSNKPYVEATTRESENRSSFYSFLIMNVILLVLGVLIFFDIIPIAGGDTTAKIFDLIILGLLFIIFTVIGILSYEKSKALKGDAKREERLTEEIIEYTVKAYEDPDLTDMSDEEKYFERDKKIRELITEKFKGLKESYLDYVSEIVYTEIFPDNN